MKGAFPGAFGYERLSCHGWTADKRIGFVSRMISFQYGINDSSRVRGNPSHETCVPKRVFVDDRSAQVQNTPDALHNKGLAPRLQCKNTRSKLWEPRSDASYTEMLSGH